MPSNLDKRLHAYRDDLADVSLEGKVKATRFVTGEAATIKAHFVDLLKEPREGSGLNTQIIHGHDVMVFERKNGWAWVQRVDDGYVGYCREDCLTSDASIATHMVLAPRTFLYPTADLQHPRVGYRSMGSKISVADKATTRGTDYLILDTGEAVIAGHAIELGDWKSDPVSVAETLLYTPYLWGGDTGFGIDCSGMVSTANMLCGKTVLRDSDMQAASIGDVLDTDFTDLKRGDLVFWKGHVGMMMDQKNLLHSNGNTMNVAIEDLAGAIKRIGYLYGQPTIARRPE
ncbi:MAG: NlpC/P60 family protein [Rhizobiaceae bacterium]